MGINVETVLSNENEIIWAVMAPHTQYWSLFRREPGTNASLYSASSVYEKFKLVCTASFRLRYVGGNISATQAFKFFQRKRLGRL